jgi:predicted nucleic acid-binding protein
LRETRRIPTERFGVPDEIGWRLHQRHAEPLPESGSPVDVRDPDDETVLASAIAAEAKIWVSGDGSRLA